MMSICPLQKKNWCNGSVELWMENSCVENEKNTIEQNVYGWLNERTEKKKQIEMVYVLVVKIERLMYIYVWNSNLALVLAPFYCLNEIHTAISSSSTVSALCLNIYISICNVHTAIRKRVL